MARDDEESPEERWLREELKREASKVEPSKFALARIQRKIRAAKRRRLRRLRRT